MVAAVLKMASICFEPPPVFDFQNPDEWPHWKRRFEQFRLATGLSKKEESRQVSSLLYCLREEGEDVLLALKIVDKAKMKYDEVLNAFDTYFRVRKNVIFERAKFNSRNQLDGESVEQYVVDLHSLARNCNFGALSEELIRDRIVIGITDKALSRRLQLDPSLTLKKVIKIVRQTEAVQQQQLQQQQSVLKETHRVKS